MVAQPPIPVLPRSTTTKLSHAIEACVIAVASTRNLDAVICAAVFPPLAGMQELEPGIWQNADGERVRALHYTRSWKAAATLVPLGCWIEYDCGDVIVRGPNCEARGFHDLLPFALCLAALRARLLAEELLQHHPDLLQEQCDV